MNFQVNKVINDNFDCMEIRTIKHNSNEYEQMINLRVTQLLEPIGVPASYIEREKEQDDILIGAFEENEIIGCCVLTPKDKEILQLRQMAVKKELRGKGIGAAIIEFAEKVAKENNFSILMMHARDPVIDFYKKCGYEISGEQFFEVGIPHHKMQKKLF
jgi:predicted GNAT family N-acyltransferase